MLRYLLVHDELGIYLGSCLGLGFWSKEDPCGQTEAVAFPSEAEARAHVGSWRPSVGKYDPDDFRYVEVEAAGKDGYATMEECVDAGQAPWPLSEHNACRGRNCDSKDNLQWRRLPTQYSKEHLNWMWSCEACFDEAADHYLDLWNEIARY